jgi:hypothetical protein
MLPGDLATLAAPAFPADFLQIGRYRQPWSTSTISAATTVFGKPIPRLYSILEKKSGIIFVRLQEV